MKLPYWIIAGCLLVIIAASLYLRRMDEDTNVSVEEKETAVPSEPKSPPTLVNLSKRVGDVVVNFESEELNHAAVAPMPLIAAGEFMTPEEHDALLATQQRSKSYELELKTSSVEMTSSFARPANPAVTQLPSQLTGALKTSPVQFELPQPPIAK